MNPIEWFAWLTRPDGLMAVLSSNWLLGSLIVAAIVFLETGLVVLPFLPGDSLLFATGAFLGVAGVSPLPSLAMITLAAIAGDALNYSLGRSRTLGGRLLARIPPAHAAQARAYFSRYGGMTVTLARFIPIVRTVAPFVAGLTHMPARGFAVFNVLGAIAWTGSLIMLGYLLGAIDWVRANLHWLSLAIVLLSVGPIAVKLLAGRRAWPGGADA